MPIGWTAVGVPAAILPPGRQEDIWSIQEQLDFPKEVFGVDRSPDMMAEIMARYTQISLDTQMIESSIRDSVDQPTTAPMRPQKTGGIAGYVL